MHIPLESLATFLIVMSTSCMIRFSDFMVEHNVAGVKANMAENNKKT